MVNSGACTPEGTGGSAINPNSTAIFILQSKDEVLMVREGPGRPALLHGWPPASRPGEVHAEHVRPLDGSL